MKVYNGIDVHRRNVERFEVLIGLSVIERADSDIVYYLSADFVGKILVFLWLAVALDSVQFDSGFVLEDLNLVHFSVLNLKSQTFVDSSKCLILYWFPIGI